MRALLLAILGITAAAFFAAPADAVVDPTPCPGNVCSGSVTVGGKQVNYHYTEHVDAGGQFRIRFDGGNYATGSMVSFILYDVPAFGAAGYLANPLNGAQAMTEFDVNPGNTAYERRDSNGCAACIYDHVMSVDYPALAAGAYAFSFAVVQNGATGGLVNIPFYVDAAAPSNANEAVLWTGGGAPAGMGFPCADAVDNDLDYRTDCADPQCVGFVGQLATGALCQAAEAACSDEFDNDGDGGADCADSQCNGQDGKPGVAVALCQYGNETGAATCGDGFDNDADGSPDCTDATFNAGAGGSAATVCWKQAAFGCTATEMCATPMDDDLDQNFSAAFDNAPGTGANCTDYDCAGNAACPSVERLTAGGDDADGQCFDGMDNDLDTLFDCSDPDCVGILDPVSLTKVCTDKEFDLGQRYQYCGNGFNDDGDASADCADSDCSRKFGSCGPCPTREDYEWASCADGDDNDNDAVPAADCGDADCSADLGSVGANGANAAACSAAENSALLCADRFDNDNDGLVDCDDGQCAGLIGPDGGLCQPAGEAACADGRDNDGDGRIDCVDANCAGVGTCAPANWVQAPSCAVVPLMSGASAFSGSAPTVTVAAAIASHVSSTHVVRLVGSGTYTSVTVIVGDNAVPANAYPYGAGACTLKDTLSGLDAARFDFTVAGGNAIQIYNTAGPDISGFDVTLSCATPALPAAIRYYPISLSAIRAGGVTEEGDLQFSTILYEHTPPTVTEVEFEGESGGTVRVPYGGASTPQSRRFRAVPNDPGAGVMTSGICRCLVDVVGLEMQTGADCVTDGLSFTTDAALTVSALAEDGAGNEGASSAPQNFTVNVTPVLATPLSVLGSPFYRAIENTVSFSAEFVTGASDSFGATCSVYLRNEAGTLLGPGPLMTFPGIAAGNTIQCLGGGALPALTDGRYYATVSVTDSDADSLESNRRALYYCNTVPGPGDAEPLPGQPGFGCQYADFDNDGAAEGLFTALYSAAPKACDNCIGLANASQSDVNANGVGDACEPKMEYGRCEIDTDIVCLYDSDDAAHSCPTGELCCPGPSIMDDPDTGAPKDPQLCKKVWGLCTLDGDFCFEDTDCPGGPGLCEGTATACYRDTDCVSLPGSPACTGADRCENLLFPWLQTVEGNVFSGKRITAPDAPPANQFNATYCITAKDTIVNFRTEGKGSCAAVTDAASRLEFPEGGNSYTTALGKLDINGLRAGKYGQVVNLAPGGLQNAIANAGGKLGGKVFRVTGSDSIGGLVLSNDLTNGAGTIFIDGGNLTITGNITYQAATVTTLRQLASLGIVVLADGAGAGGNLSVNKDVTEAVGAAYVNGSAGFASVAAPDTDGPLPLTWYGLVVARKFQLSRSYKSLTGGAETFIYDGRAVVNPPPGFGDVTRALPSLGDTVVP